MITREQAAELVAEERAEQGLPPKVEDIGVLTRVADILQSVDDELAEELGVKQSQRKRKR